MQHLKEADISSPSFANWMTSHIDVVEKNFGFLTSSCGSIYTCLKVIYRGFLNSFLVLFAS